MLCLFQEKFAPIPGEGVKANGEVMSLHSLTFLVTLARDQNSPIKKSHHGHFGRSVILDMSELRVEDMWDMYRGFDNK